MSKKRFSSNNRSESMFHGESTGTSFRPTTITRALQRGRPVTTLPNPV